MVSAMSEPGVGADGGPEAIEIARLDEGGRNSETRQGVGEEIDGSAVERGRRHDVVARAHQRRDGKVHGRHAAGVQTAPTPASSAASRSSRTAVVGLEMRV